MMWSMDASAGGKPIHKGVDRDEKQKITKFWKKNYKYGDCAAPKLDQGKVFSLFQTRIIALTETHFIQGEHLNPEVLKYLPNYDIVRTDRDTDYDENALEKDGGTLIMTSHDVLCRGVKKYCVSNGI